MAVSQGRVEGGYKPILPAGRRVVVRPHETPTYKGNIILPGSVKEMVPTTGVILALGFDLEDGKPFKEGDAIIFSKYAGVEISFDDGKRIVIVHEDDVLGIVEGEALPQETAAV